MGVWRFDVDIRGVARAVGGGLVTLCGGVFVAQRFEDVPASAFIVVVIAAASVALVTYVTRRPEIPSLVPTQTQRGEVVDPGFTAGRSSELLDAQRHLTSSTEPLAVLGPMGIGKSHFMTAVIASATGPNDLSFIVECSDVSSDAEFWSAIAAKVVGAALPASNENIDAVAAQRVRLLGLDGMDHWLRISPERARKALDGVPILVGARVVYTCRDVITRHHHEPITLGGLDDVASRSVVEHCAGQPLPITKSTRSMLSAIDGHPAALCVLGRLIGRAGSARVIAWRFDAARTDMIDGWSVAVSLALHDRSLGRKGRALAGWLSVTGTVGLELLATERRHLSLRRAGVLAWMGLLSRSSRALAMPSVVRDQIERHHSDSAPSEQEARAAICSAVLILAEASERSDARFHRESVVGIEAVLVSEDADATGAAVVVALARATWPGDFSVERHLRRCAAELEASGDRVLAARAWLEIASRLEMSDDGPLFHVGLAEAIRLDSSAEIKLEADLLRARAGEFAWSEIFERATAASASAIAAEAISHLVRENHDELSDRLDLAGYESEAVGLAYVWRVRAMRSWNAHEDQDARKALEQSAASAIDSGDRRAEVDSLLLLAPMLSTGGFEVEHRAAAHRVLNLSAAIGYRRGEGIGCIFVALSNTTRRDRLRLAERGIELLTEGRDDRWLYRAHQYLGGRMSDLGENRRAETHWLAAGRLAPTPGDLFETRLSYAACVGKRDAAAAERLYGELHDELTRDTGGPLFRHQSLHAEFHLSRGDFRLTNTDLSEAEEDLRIAEDLGQGYLQALCAEKLFRVAWAGGKYPSSKEHLSRAVALFRNHAAPSEASALAHMNLGRFRQSEPLLCDAASIWTRLANHRNAGDAYEEAARYTLDPLRQQWLLKQAQEQHCLADPAD